MYFMSSEHPDAAEPVVLGPNGRKFYGSVTVGERGQVVIPAQARRDHGIQPGDKLLALGSPDGLALLSAERLLELLEDSTQAAVLLSTAVEDAQRRGSDGQRGHRI
jgi:AbrB family looped-hinge helix DNA binding protein